MSCTADFGSLDMQDLQAAQLDQGLSSGAENIHMMTSNVRLAWGP